MKNLRGLIPEFTICANPPLNLFVSRVDGTDVIMRQPRRKDSGKQRTAWADLSEASKKRYRRANVSKDLYDMNYRAKLPLYKGEVPGWMPMIMEVDDNIVAFVDIMFMYGTGFQKFLIRLDEKGMACSIGVIDRYQGLGLGTMYSYLTDCIGRHFKIDWILGDTYLNNGMRNIRIKDDWQLIRTYRASSGEIMVSHKKRLSK